MASWISRVRLEVITTIGGWVAFTVPSSGIVTWKSASTSKQERLERLVGAVELVDQQHRGAGRIGLERLQQRPLDQKPLREHVVLQPLAVLLALRLRHPDGDHLRRIVPFVDRGRHVEPLVALQADEPAPERAREHLGDLGLADAGLALEKQRAAHLEGEEQDGRERPVGEVVGRGKEREGFVDGGWR